MKPQIRKLKVGERVWAIIEEVLESNEIIVNFSGDLLRIANESNGRFRAGQRVLLSVQNMYPLRFKLMTPNPLRGSPHLDLSI